VSKYLPYEQPMILLKVSSKFANKMIYQDVSPSKENGCLGTSHESAKESDDLKMTSIDELTMKQAETNVTSNKSILLQEEEKLALGLQ
jgi:hypothetical protein